MTAEGRCVNCGAPYQEGLAECGYCDVPIQGRSQGVDCPSCGELATADRRSCAACSASFMKGCLFCGQSAFVSAAACPRCSEAFAGAEDRKKQREEAAKQQQVIGLAAQGLGLLGQVAGNPSARGVLSEIIDAVIHSNDRNKGGR